MSQERRDELARTIAFANALGVRAEVIGDAKEKERAKRMWTEAMDELAALELGAKKEGRDA